MSLESINYGPAHEHERRENMLERARRGEHLEPLEPDDDLRREDESKLKKPSLTDDHARFGEPNKSEE